MNQFVIKYEGDVVSQIADQLMEAIDKDKELFDIAEQITYLGLHQQWLGQEVKNKKMVEVGLHLYKLGGNLTALGLIRLKNRGEIA